MLGAARGPVGQVHRVGLVDVEELEVEPFGDEGTERREQQRDALEDFEQRRLRRERIRTWRVRVGAPEPPSAAPHVPVGQVVDQLRQRVGAAERFVAVERVRHRDGDVLDAREDPLVDRRTFAQRRNFGVGGVELVERGVGAEETEGVPQRRQGLAQ